MHMHDSPFPCFYIFILLTYIYIKREREWGLDATRASPAHAINDFGDTTCSLSWSGLIKHSCIWHFCSLHLTFYGCQHIDNIINEKLYNMSDQRLQVFHTAVRDTRRYIQKDCHVAKLLWGRGTTVVDATTLSWDESGTCVIMEEEEEDGRRA